MRAPLNWTLDHMLQTGLRTKKCYQALQGQSGRVSPGARQAVKMNEVGRSKDSHSLIGLSLFLYF